MKPKETGHLFSSEMIWEILDEWLEQDRVLVTPRPHKRAKSADRCTGGQWHFHDSLSQFGNRPRGRQFRCEYRSPLGDIGDLVWVKESFAFSRKVDGQQPDVLYRADCGSKSSEVEWLSPTCMPKWAARTWLKITDVRVERVKDITEEDAEAFLPGCHFSWCSRPVALDGYPLCDCGDYGFRDAYRMEWIDLHGQESWDNDWCWVYEFKRVERK